MAWIAGVGRLFIKILMGMLLKIVELLKAKAFNVMAEILPAVWHDAPCGSSRPVGLMGWEWTAVILNFGGHATPSLIQTLY